MRKVIFTIAILALSFVALGQESGSFISVSGGLGGGGFQYTPKGIHSDGISKDKLGWNANIGYSYYFTRHWGLATGVGVSYYRTIGKYDVDFSKGSFYSLGDQTDNDPVVGAPNDYELRVRLANWEEEQKGYFIEIPLMAMFQHKFGETQRHGIYVGLGVKLQIPVFAQYRVLDGKYEDDLRLNVSGAYYGGSNLELGGPGDPNLAAHGFGSIYNPGSSLDWNGDLNLKMSIAGTAEIGFLIGLSRRVDLTVGGYFDYGFNNIKKGDNKAFLEAPQQYIPNADNHIGNGIQYNGMINTDRTNKVNLMAYGAKIGIRIKLGKLSGEPLDTVPVPEIIPDIIEDDADLDSLERQLEEMRRLLEELLREPEIVPVQEEADIVVQGTIMDAKTREPLSAIVEITDARTNKLVAITRTDSINGQYKFPLTDPGNYILDVRKEGYLYYSEDFNIPALNEKQVINQLVLLNKIEVNQVIILKNIFFDTGKSTLKPESMSEIDHVYKLMIDNPTMEIEISGHTDNVGSETVNKRLSLARANVVVQTLVNKGISPSRMTSAGYGFDRPVAPNTTAEGRAQNRRTEFKVTKM